MQKIIKAILFFLSPILSIYIVEYFSKLDLHLVYDWMVGDPKKFILTYVILLLIQILIVSIANNLIFSLIIFQLIFMLIGAINYYKLKFLNTPFLPWDIGFAKQIVDLIPQLSNSINIKLIIITAIIAVAILILVIKFTSFKMFSWKKRLVIFIISLVPIFMLYNFQSNFWGKLFKEVKIENEAWDPIYGLKNNGFVINFISKFPDLKIDEPEGYSKELVNDILKSMDLTDEQDVSDLKPNIVMIMSEAYWELGNFDSVNGEELYPTTLKYKVGQNISPQFGGGTSNVEFEAITGYSTNLLPQGSVPYQQYVKGNVPSLVSVLNEYGYSSTALHTFYKYFWSRNTAYPSLGFEDFIGLEDLKKPDYYGVNVDDKVIGDLIVDQIKTSEKPKFIYAVTMQNHAMYDDNRFGDKTLQLVDGYSDKTNAIINTYATGIKHSDEMLAQLFEQIEELDEPTLVVFFGDHLPYLENAYAELGYVKDMNNKTPEEELKMKETPLVVWNNYDKEIDQVGGISTSFLSPHVLKWAELELPAYYQFIEKFSEQLPGYTALIKMTNKGVLSTNTPDELKQMEYNYSILQYDLLFGKRYALEFEK